MKNIFGTALILEVFLAISAGLGVFVMVCALSTGVGWAQDAPAYPAGLDDPSIDLEELQLRLIPLSADQLGSLAAAWQEQARAAAQATVDKSLEIRATEGTETEALREKRLALLKERGLIFEKYLAVVSSLEAKGGDPAEVALLRDYISAIRTKEKSELTLQEFADSFLKWLVSPEGGVGIGFRIAVIAGSLFGLFIVARIVRSWAGCWAGR